MLTRVQLSGDPLRNLPMAPRYHHRELLGCFLTFSEFTAYTIQECRHFFRSCTAKISAIALKYLSGQFSPDR